MQEGARRAPLAAPPWSSKNLQGDFAELPLVAPVAAPVRSAPDTAFSAVVVVPHLQWWS